MHFLTETPTMRRTGRTLWAGLVMTAVTALPAIAQLAFPESELSYSECADLQASDFEAVSLVRRGSGTGAGADPSMEEPLKMAFDMDAQGKVDVYFAQRYGKVRKYSGASETTVTLADFGFSKGSSVTDTMQLCLSCASNGGTFNSSEGLMAIALDPEFKSNGWVYLYVTVKSNWRVTRYKLTGNVLDLSSGKTIWRTTHPPFSQHMGVALRFDGDGNLWISVSDNASTGNSTAPYSPDIRFQSANSNSPFGKILRIKPRPLADNQPAPAPGPGSTYDVPGGNLRSRFYGLADASAAGQDTGKISRRFT